MDWSALRLSLELAVLTAAILLPLSVLIARQLAWRSFGGRSLIEAALALPLVLPPTVLGYYLLVAFGARSPLGQAWIRLTGRPLAFSFGGLLVASLLYSLPFAVQPFTASLSRVDRRLVEASWSLGVSRIA